MPGRRTSRTRPRALPLAAAALSAGVAALLLSGLVTAAGARPSPPSPSDVAATHTYLAAKYAFELALVANLPASLAGAEAAAAGVGERCGGALTGRPLPPSPSSASAIVAHLREEARLDDLGQELSAESDAAFRQPDRGAEATFASAIGSLGWSESAVTEIVRSEASGLKENLDAPALDVCADIAAWSAGGHAALPPATEALLARLRAREARVSALLAEGAEGPLDSLLSPFEGPPERSLQRQIEALAPPLSAAGERLAAREEQLDATVGIEAEREDPLSGGVTIARRRTAGGGRFFVLLRASRRQVRSHCRLEMSIVRSGQHGEPGGAVGGLCVSPVQGSAAAGVNCEEGALTIQAYTIGRARRVRLLLSNGRTITSPVVSAPAGLGASSGLYYQVVRGPSPIPVSLTELSAHGRALRVLKLPRVLDCTTQRSDSSRGG
jgi:hypothetical protein